jgi:hypothetical protein
MGRKDMTWPRIAFTIIFFICEIVYFCAYLAPASLAGAIFYKIAGDNPMAGLVWYIILAQVVLPFLITMGNVWEWLQDRIDDSEARLKERKDGF